MKKPKPNGTISKYETSYSKEGVIIGIDPGLYKLGIGIIKLNNSLKFEMVKNKRDLIQADALLQFIEGYSYMLVKPKPTLNIEHKLSFIFETICNLIEEYNPKLIVIEDAFVGINKNSAIKLGMAKGAIFTAIGKFQIPITNISPKEIKMQITSKGDAVKEELQLFFEQNFKNWETNKALDSTDALAAAFCGIRSFLEITYIK